ncbi:stalk domain-containing protein [Cohnella zeiphila]|uniref:Copper amine oxidase N-terminal domain-containing protein n=1 Tax=Cohnella zeiphila TaxID=2761120 RepID=A0A7X0VVQ2_9BACL|nr:stalk domain-containing protein [Cohnella zeiphila]MBB6731602.1 copper amine oxidase N-terminal domain-containing protein [Cohnella zeiphila]
MRKALSAVLLLSLAFPAGAYAGSADDGSSTLVLYKNQTKVTLDGVDYQAAQPTVYSGGSAYASLSAMAARYGYVVRYDASTKESIVTSSDKEIRWKIGVSSYTVNGTTTSFAGVPFSTKGSLMIPVRAWATATGSDLSVTGTTISLSWQQILYPTADFTVDPAEIYANQTTVTYTSHSANASAIVSERWEGNDTVFAEPGPHTITRWVQNAAGEWSDPYSVTINVLPQNEPPTAMFTTDKDTYKIGEPIKYTDLSTDDENAIVSADFSNNKPVFFTPGTQRIHLTVTDKHGLTSEYEKTIEISDQVMYTEQQYNERYTEPGEKFDIEGSNVLGYSLVPYTFTVSNRALIASNSPEVLTKEGILYRDTMNGDFRLFLYHQNSGTKPLAIYLAAKNEGTENATVSLGSSGQAGPNSFGLWTGKLASERYLESKTVGETKLTTLAPGETELIMPELGNTPLKLNDVFSAYADLSTTAPVQFTLFAVYPDNRAPLNALATFGNLPRDGKHIRGTFQGADREVQIDSTLGSKPQRILFGDHTNDPALDGRDMLNGVYENNWGNFGVVYHMTVHVAPNTLITANARGGVYSGVFKINDTAVLVSNSSLLQNPNQACVLYRTGPYEEVVEISFMTALGSNLPVNILFQPLPQPAS